MKSGFAGTDRLITKMLRGESGARADRAHDRPIVETQAPQAGTALLLLIMSARLARTPRQFVVLFYPKVGVICTITVLISRSSLEAKQLEGQSANFDASHPSRPSRLAAEPSGFNTSEIALRWTESKHSLAQHCLL